MFPPTGRSCCTAPSDETGATECGTSLRDSGTFFSTASAVRVRLPRVAFRRKRREHGIFHVDLGAGDATHRARASILRPDVQGGVVAGMAEVAARAGVSSGVVSRVISGDSSLRISDDTRSRVLQAVEDLQYVPRYAARALRYQKPSALTLVLPDATSAVHAPLVRGVEQAAARRDLGMMLTSSEHINEQPEWLDRIVREGRTDGVIFQAPPELRPAQIMAVTDVPAPVILINSDETSSDRTLVFDDAAGVSVAVRFLADLGHRGIGFIGAPAEHAAGSRRLSGFTTSMRSLGYRVHEEWITRCGFTSEQGRTAARVLLKQETLPTAVIVANLNAATGFLAELHSNSIDVPGRLSIVAFHDAWLAESTWPPLTTVQMPFFEMGAAAVDMLFDSESGPEHRVISAPVPLLMQRQSARPL